MQYSLLAFTLVFIGVVGSTAPNKDPEAMKWIAGENETCFMANMGVQWHVKYNKSGGGNKSSSEDVFFNFDNATTVNVVACNSSSSKVKFTTIDNATITLSFVSDNDTTPTMYWLSSISILYEVSEDEFPNATNVGEMITADAKLDAFKTPTGKSYTCSIESQIRLTSNSSDATDVYIRLTNPSDSPLQLQATRFMKNYTFGNESKCFWDKTKEKSTKNTYKAMNGSTTCGMLTTVLGLDVSYETIHGATKMTTTVPIGNNASAYDSSCGKNTTTINIMLQAGIGNASLVFKTKSVKDGYFGTTVDEFQLSSLTFTYDVSSEYFPNHEDMDVTVTIKNETLSEFMAPVGMSYTCSAATHVKVSNNMTATFSEVQLQPFKVVNDSYAKASDCQATPVTTPAQTTTPLPKPEEPDAPPAFDRKIMSSDDNKTVCLNATLGLQLTMMYQKKSYPDGNMTHMYFNYDPDNCTVEAHCKNETAVVKFTRKGNYDQSITLVFTKDQSKNTTYLSQVKTTYTINGHFPDAKENGTKAYYNVTTQYFNTSDTKSYECSKGTDVLMTTNADMAIVRMTGIRIDAFPSGSKKAQKCFSDQPVKAPTTGTYYVNHTTKGNESVCAAFKLSLDAKVTYSQLVDTEPKTVYIPVHGTTLTPQDGSYGTCDVNVTTLTIPLDDGKLNFTFTFKKKNITGKNFRYSMASATLTYMTDTKYFPNHEYRKGGVVSYTNKSLDLFTSDQDHSYKCNVNTTADVAMEVKMSFSDVQVEPFGVDEDNGSFKAVDECGDDDLSPLIPIIVGSVLAGLVVIVLVAYIIGRRRSRGASYESI